MMKKAAVLVLLAFLLLSACNPKPPVQPTYTLTPTAVYTPGTLHPNPVETSMPIYGSTLVESGPLPRSFDGHQQVAYGPTVVLPVFNQLVVFDLNYKDTIPETIIGDLATKWETSADQTEITFYLPQGVKWHDGVPFTADDVVYSLDKMTDFNRSAISGTFPAYESAEKLDDYTVKVHLKYPSAGFMISLAAGEAVIEAKHLEGTDDQSKEFMVGTGPFILADYVPQVSVKYKRNPEYWKKDKYGNQLPYLDGIDYYYTTNALNHASLIARRQDIKNTTTGVATADSFDELRNGAPDLLFQRREKDASSPMFLNMNHPPLNDIRVRRAMALIIDEEDLAIGYAGDATLGLPDSGLLTPSFGLPKEEVRQLMGWDKSMDERIAEARQLMTEAGYYPSGFKLNILAQGGSTMVQGGVAMVYSDALRQALNITAEIHTALTTIEVNQRITEDNYDVIIYGMRLGQDPISLATYFTTDGYGNYSHYSNPIMDKMLGDLDHIVDPDERREAIWDIERTLLTDLPALPTGCFIANYMPYYPWVKNIRWNGMAYSAANRLEDVWIDESLRPK